LHALKLDGTARILSPRNLQLTEPNLSRQTAKGRRSLSNGTPPTRSRLGGVRS
jgi:hypothetical protein